MTKRHSKSPKKRKSLKRRKSPKKIHNDGGIFQDMYNYIHDLFYINERRVRPYLESESKKTPESSKKTTQNDEITSSLASSSSVF